MSSCRLRMRRPALGTGRSRSIRASTSACASWGSIAIARSNRLYLDFIAVESSIELMQTRKAANIQLLRSWKDNVVSRSYLNFFVFLAGDLAIFSDNCLRRLATRSFSSIGRSACLRRHSSFILNSSDTSGYCLFMKTSIGFGPIVSEAMSRENVHQLVHIY